MGKLLTSISQLAKAVGRSKSTVHAWLHDDQWEFARIAPWDADQVEAMTSWAEVYLREDRAREQNDADGFFKLRGDYRALRPLSPDYAVTLIELDKMPAEVVCPFELDVIAGRATLTAAEVRDVVEDFAHFRAYMIDACRWMPEWLVGYDAREVSRRMRSEAYCRAGWIQNAWQNMQDRREGIERDDDGNIIKPRKRKQRAARVAS